MNRAAYNALRTMMAKGASKHQSQISRAVENLIAWCDNNSPPGYRSKIPYVDLRECPAVVNGQVLRDAGRVANVSVAVAAITATSNPEFAGRTPRDLLVAAVEGQGELRYWVDQLARIGPDSVLAEHDRRMDVLVMPDGSGVVNHGTVRWVLAHLTDPDSNFVCVQCHCTAADPRASNALAIYLENHPAMRLTRTEAITAPRQLFQFRGEGGELEVLPRDELIAKVGRLRSFFSKGKDKPKDKEQS